MMFKVEITMPDGDRFSFVARNMKCVGTREVTICDIQDIEVLEEWDRNIISKPREMPILGNPRVKFTPNKP